MSSARTTSTTSTLAATTRASSAIAARVVVAGVADQRRAPFEARLHGRAVEGDPVADGQVLRRQAELGVVSRGNGDGAAIDPRHAGRDEMVAELLELGGARDVEAERGELILQGRTPVSGHRRLLDQATRTGASWMRDDGMRVYTVMPSSPPEIPGLRSPVYAPRPRSNSRPDRRARARHSRWIDSSLACTRESSVPKPVSTAGMPRAAKPAQHRQRPARRHHHRRDAGRALQRRDARSA